VASNYHRAVCGLCPISAQIALCDACFNRCANCNHYNREYMERMPWERLQVFLAVAFQMGLESACYSGGDPFAYKDWNKVARMHTEYDVAFGVTVAGYVPTSIDLQLLANARWVRVSLDAITPSGYARARGGVSVEKVLSGIDRMLGAGVNVQLGVTVDRHNQDEIDGIMDYAKQQGIKEVFVHPIYHGTGEDAEWADADQEREPIPFQHCHACLYQIYVGADGGVYPCCRVNNDTGCAPLMAPLANIFEDSLEGIMDALRAWRSQDRSELPHVCRASCVRRLAEINHIGDKLAKMPIASFF
jgi:MoaA/NifB/PqqE/SkfB family radical SAM enzyme